MNEEQEQRRNEDENLLIRGKFILCLTDIDNRDTLTYVKLSEIKTIKHISDYEGNIEGDFCSFNTYKDHQYFTYVAAHRLVKIINGLDHHND